MTDTPNDPRAEAQAAVQYWSQRLDELNAQEASEAPPIETPSQPFAVPEPPIGPSPKDVATQVFDRAIADGAREEDAGAVVIAALARRALGGDPRFIYTPPAVSVGGVVVE